MMHREKLSAAGKGNPLRTARERAKMSQFDVAAAVKISLVSVGRWERGEVVPSEKAMAAMAKLFDVAPAAWARRWDKWRAGRAAQ